MVRGTGNAAGASPRPEGRWPVDARARSTTIMAQSDRIDDGIALVNTELMSMMTDIDGCMGLSMLVDRIERPLHRHELVGLRSGHAGE